VVEDAFGLPIARLLAPAGTDDQESDEGERLLPCAPSVSVAAPTPGRSGS
jgi:hypothetical protein